MPGREQDVELADPVYRRFDDVAGAPSGPVQDLADAVLLASAGILKVEREKTGGNRSCKATGWLCAVVVSNPKRPLTLHGRGRGLNSRF